MFEDKTGQGICNFIALALNDLIAFIFLEHFSSIKLKEDLNLNFDYL